MQSGINGSPAININLILIAGLPATGKSAFADYVGSQLGISLICKDSIKEVLFDTVGFHSHDEKTKLNVASLELLLYFAERLLEQGLPVILENNFENSSKPQLQELINRYRCNVVTVFFGGDEDVIYKRYVERNACPDRHRGHVLSTEYPERVDIGHIPTPISLEEFKRSFRERGMSEPPIAGKTIFVDTTDFSTVSYDAILEELILER